MKQYSTNILAMAIGIGIGSIIPARFFSRNEVRHYNTSNNRVPHGYLVAKSKGPEKARMGLRLQRSSDSNSDNTITHHSGAAEAYPFGTISFGYPLADTPRFGDIIIVRLDLIDGSNKTIVITNGVYGVVFENPNFTLYYTKDYETS